MPGRYSQAAELTLNRRNKYEVKPQAFHRFRRHDPFPADGVFMAGPR
jgi:hypothetical protein